jgi:Tol biopolymer transport system component
LWTKIYGPSSFNISNANVAQTPLVNLVPGVYQFELKVTDAGALSDTDTMMVTVMAGNQPPASTIQPSECTNCKIAFVSNRDGNAEIYSCNADGSDVVRLTNNAGIDDQPQWSPTGSHIAFISDRTGHPEIYIMNADGSNVVRKTFSGGSQHPTWSPDGKRIAYSTLSNGSANIWVVGAASGSPSLLFEKPGVEDHPSWSPDGTRMVLFSDWNAYDFVYDIYTINSDGTNFAGLTGDMFDRVDYLNPSWSPDGTRIAMAISKTEGTQVGIMNPDGSGLTAIISGAAPRTRTSWSVDGTKIAYTSLSESRNDISWVSADGSTSGTIVTNGRNADW